MSVTYTSTSFGQHLPTPLGSPSGRSSRQSFHSVQSSYRNSLSSEPAEQETTPVAGSSASLPTPQTSTLHLSSAELAAKRDSMNRMHEQAMSAFFFGGAKRLRSNSRVDETPVSPTSPSPAPSLPAIPSSPSPPVNTSFSPLSSEPVHIEEPMRRSPTPTPTANEPTPVEVVRAQYDAISSFFGGRPNSTSVSSPATSPADQVELARTGTDRIPPSYSSSGVDTESLPSYNKVDVDGHATFIRKVFFWGFLFPPIWLFGMLLPFVSPVQPGPTVDNRSKEDKDADLARMRSAELRWSLRCACALLTLIIAVALAIILAIVFTRKR